MTTLFVRTNASATLAGGRLHAQLASAPAACGDRAHLVLSAAGGAAQGPGKLSAIEPPLRASLAAAGRLRANNAGDALLLTTPAGAVVLQPPSHWQFKDAGPTPSTTATFIGGATPLATCPPVDAVWHPISSRHVVTLSEDGVRLFDVTADCAVPIDEMLFPPGALAAKPTACAFGAARGWELLCLFILCEDGAVYYVTPVLPFGALLPSADVRELQELAAHVASAASGSAGVHPAAALAAQVSLAWLSDAFQPIPGEASWLRFLPDAAASGALASAIPTNTGVPLAWGAAEPAASGYASGGRRSVVAPALQGPVTVVPDVSTRSERGAAAGKDSEGRPPPPAPACDLWVVPAAVVPDFPALQLLFSDGRMASVACTDPVAPAWGLAAGAADGVPPAAPGAAVVEVAAPGAALAPALASAILPQQSATGAAHDAAARMAASGARPLLTSSVGTTGALMAAGAGRSARRAADPPEDHHSRSHSLAHHLHHHPADAAAAPTGINAPPWLVIDATHLHLGHPLAAAAATAAPGAASSAAVPGGSVGGPQRVSIHPSRLLLLLPTSAVASPLASAAAAAAAAAAASVGWPAPPHDASAEKQVDIVHAPSFLHDVPASLVTGSAALTPLAGSATGGALATALPQADVAFVLSRRNVTLLRFSWAPFACRLLAAVAGLPVEDTAGHAPVAPAALPARKKGDTTTVYPVYRAHDSGQVVGVCVGGVAASAQPATGSAAADASGGGMRSLPAAAVPGVTPALLLWLVPDNTAAAITSPLPAAASGADTASTTAAAAAAAAVVSGGSAVTVAGLTAVCSVNELVLAASFTAASASAASDFDFDLTDARTGAHVTLAPAARTGVPLADELMALTPFSGRLQQFAETLATGPGSAPIFERPRVDPANPASVFQAKCALADRAATVAASLLKVKEETYTRADLLVHVAGGLHDGCAALAKRVHDLQERSERKAAEMERRQRIADNLRQRAEAVCFGLQLLVSRLSDAEVAYGAEVGSYNRRVVERLQPELKALKDRLARLLPATAATTATAGSAAGAATGTGEAVATPATPRGASAGGGALASSASAAAGTPVATPIAPAAAAASTTSAETPVTPSVGGGAAPAPAAVALRDVGRVLERLKGGVASAAATGNGQHQPLQQQQQAPATPAAGGASSSMMMLMSPGGVAPTATGPTASGLVSAERLVQLEAAAAKVSAAVARRRAELAALEPLLADLGALATGPR